ncbi:unnamed protein product, partial [Didymodactylos carnosus]
CSFHFGQCIWREVRSQGLQNRHVNDDDFRLNVKKLMALAFVPVHDVVRAYTTIVANFDDAADRLHEYFDKVCIEEKKTQSSARKKPQFAHQLWNVYDRVVHNSPRSNNAVEGWHHVFANRVSIVHPSDTKLADRIRWEQSRYEIQIERLDQG